jgi:hypothetical protein
MSCADHFTPEIDPVPTVQETGLAPRKVWPGAEDVAFTGIQTPDRPDHRESPYRPTLLQTLVLIQVFQCDSIAGMTVGIFRHGIWVVLRHTSVIAFHLYTKCRSYCSNLMNGLPSFKNKLNWYIHQAILGFFFLFVHHICNHPSGFFLYWFTENAVKLLCYTNAYMLLVLKT